MTDQISNMADHDINELLFQINELEPPTEAEEMFLQQLVEQLSDELFTQEKFADALAFIDKQVAEIRTNEALMSRNAYQVKAAQSRKKAFERTVKFRRMLLDHAINQLHNNAALPERKVQGPDYLAYFTKSSSIQVDEQLTEFAEAWSAFMEDVSQQLLDNLLVATDPVEDTIFYDDLNLQYSDQIQALKDMSQGFPLDIRKALTFQMKTKIDTAALKIIETAGHLWTKITKSVLTLKK